MAPCPDDSVLCLLCWVLLPPLTPEPEIPERWGVSGLMLAVARSLGMSRLFISSGPQTSLEECCPRPPLIHPGLSRVDGGGRDSAGLLEN